MSLKFEEILPDESLSNIVRRFFIIEYSDDKVRKDFFLPDGTPSLFYLNPVSGKFRCAFHAKEKVYDMAEGVYVGYGDTLMEYQHYKLRLIGVNVYPIYLSILFGITPDMIMNDFLTLEQLKLPTPLDRSEMSVISSNQVVEIFEKFLHARIQQNTFSDKFLVLYKRLIEPGGHHARVEDLAKWLGYSTRYLGVIFYKYLGMSPKKFLELARFNHALKLMDDQGDQPNLTRVAHEAGYHDQAHFIRDFKKVCGKTPRELAIDKGSLAHKFRFFNSD